ncbi:Dihydrolipoamide acetyltransferase component of pyruvate dehydrogenase complex [Aequoribacter fuscus]|uniref:Acetyltransferase component of pyruvate dehydrogenase complex n=1 Tax=Aequoribacter fuscus TaxID=2518989 RepID=F3L2M9_9GAMM|nr:dihydrolipoyllysine-residue acetyltransferase [Aequoribacter fuscus]EGG29347.1 Dihydrolipoamide acetyltransferase component of pyruvate dehydrogenase complex [Aequoribacter fuscus]QHJ87616.1 dihydrolipoyllysine-residue acetyltransferase [Aequoribacter fuscus]
MAKQQVIVPDIGADAAEVIEWMVQVGDEIAVDDSLLVLESDKASMEVPSTLAGTVVELLVNIGDSLSEGAAIVLVETADAAEPAQVAEEPAETNKTEAAVQPEVQEALVEAPNNQPVSAGKHSVLVPDIGTDDAVEVIELSVSVGDEVEEGDTLLVLESDKASMEIPADASGRVLEIAVAVGASLKQGDLIGVLEVAGRVDAPPARAQEPKQEAAPAAPAAPKAVPEQPKTAPVAKATASSSEVVYAGPAVRKLAREFSIPLEQVSGSGPRGRILKEDLHTFVQQRLSKPEAATVSVGAGIPAVPAVDFSQFGPVREEALSKIGKVTAANMQRSWLNVPHVTQYDDADVTDLEAFRASLKDEAARKGTKLTPLPFLLKACAVALKDNPKFNASLSADGESIIYKEYVHIGFAVDTPAGLLVPVIRDVDKKGLWELAEEVLELAALARDKKLKPAQMQGACFTISSLGALGGKGFTPIVNAPEVGILGVSKSSVQPVWDGSSFVPRTMLPLSVSYDHRVINGADGGRFMNQVVALLSDIRRLTL